MNELDCQMTSEDDLEEMKENFQKEYNRTHFSTMNELEVKKNLWKEIVQTKKSLVNIHLTQEFA